MWGRWICAILAVAILQGTTSWNAAAERYSVSLTRKAKNWYKVDGKNIFVRTRFCYVYAVGQDAILSPYEVTFLDDHEQCNVRAVLASSDVPKGNYSVQVYYEDDDLYSMTNGTYVRTSFCLELGMSADAV